MTTLVRPAPGPTRPRSATAARILLVEDNAELARVLALLLDRSGYRVAVAGCVAEAIAAAQSESFDLLLSDLSLPDGSGLELIRRLGLPGIALSGYSGELDIRECLEAGFVDLLSKPIDFATLIATIRRALGGAPSPAG